MNFVASLLMMSVAVVVSLMCGMGALATTHSGSDAGDWLFALPATFVGVLVAVVPYRLSEWPSGPLLRRGCFVLLASWLTATLCVLEWKVFLYANKSPEPEYVYIPGPSTCEITLPTEVAVNEPILVKAVYRSGPWQRVRYKDAGSNLTTADPTTPLIELPASRNVGLKLFTEPGGDVILGDFDDNGEARVSFTRPGAFRIWAETRNRLALMKSNVVTVTVRSR